MRLDGVWLRYGRRAGWTLREVNAELAPGETAVVLGRNGAGKSTLLQIAAGVLRPTRGAVRGRPRVLGWVPERFPADQPFTMAQYLTWMGRSRGLTSAMLTGAIAGWTERLGLTEYLDVKLADLSKGTAQKVGLAQALLARPELLILDEPWEGLDAETRDLVPEIVAEVTMAGGSVLISDHRGEVSRLLGASQWLVDGGALRVGAGLADFPVTGTCLVEVAVDAAHVGETIARLRADGYHVSGVYQP